VTAPPQPGHPAGQAEPAGLLARQVIALLRDRGQTVAVAESLTGGLLGAAITGIPGASEVFLGGVIAYATGVKASLLAVPEGLLAARGAVDPDVAAAMAAGVRLRLGASVGAATTGVAGPDPADGQVPGTVHIAVAAGGAPVTRALKLTGSRDEIRAETVREVLRLLRDVLREDTRMITALHALSEHGSLCSPALAAGPGTVELSTPREGSATMVLLRHLLGDVLRRVRLRQGRTLREVSAAARVSLGYLSEVERGQKEASSELLSAICAALDTPLSQVFREVSDNFALAELQNEPVLAGPAGRLLEEPGHVTEAPAASAFGGTGRPGLGVVQARKLAAASGPALGSVRIRTAPVAFDDEEARRMHDLTGMVPV
jgi:nicotinamide-nucleotide amidase